MYLLILPDDRDRKRNIHRNQIRKYLVFGSVLILFHERVMPNGRKRLHGKKSRGKVVK